MTATQPYKSHFDEGGQVAWDSTSLTDYMLCPHKYWLRQCDDWQTPHESVHLTFGRYYADAMSRYHGMLACGTEREEALEFTLKQVLEDSWEREVDKETGVRSGGVPWYSDHPKKNRESLIRTVIWYSEHFADDNLRVILDERNLPMTERSFQFELGKTEDGDVIQWCGHIDQVVDYGGHLYVMDQKTTTSALSPYYFKQWELSAQMSGYTLAGKIVLQQPIVGVIIDAAQINVGTGHFARHATNRSDAQLEEWIEETLDIICQARRDYQRGRFTHNTTSCTKFSGCEFKDVCARTPSVRENYLRGDFVKREWNPLEAR